MCISKIASFFSAGYVSSIYLFFVVVEKFSDETQIFNNSHPASNIYYLNYLSTTGCCIVFIQQLFSIFLLINKFIKFMFAMNICSWLLQNFFANSQ